MCTRTKRNYTFQSKHRKIFVWEELLQIINMCYDTIWTLLLQTYPYCPINSKIRKYFFLVPQFLGFIPQSSIIRTQTVINIELCLSWKVYVDLTAMLAAILAAIMDPKNIFRFAELLLKNKIVLTKY